MNMHFRILANISLVAVLSVGFSSGCGGAPNDKPHTVPVTGIVTLDGKPLEGATVRFNPTDPKKNGGTGVTDAQGKYTLVHATNDGASPGSYKVVIEHFASPDGTPVKLQEGIDMEQLKMQGAVQQTLAPKYSDFEQTELKADVKDAPNDIPFTLTSG
jgi:hypothetical protein